MSFAIVESKCSYGLESIGKDAIKIKNLPRSITRDDLLRMLAAAQAQHITEGVMVQLSTENHDLRGQNSSDKL
jgi:hypothetical protein